MVQIRSDEQDPEVNWNYYTMNPFDKYIERIKKIFVSGIIAWLLIGVFWLINYFIQFIFFLFDMFRLGVYGLYLT